MQGQTVFFIREAGNYRLELSGEVGFSWEQRLCRRAMVRLNFAGVGEYEVVVFCERSEHGERSKRSEEYCRRRFVVVEEGGLF